MSSLTAGRRVCPPHAWVGLALVSLLVPAARCQNEAPLKLVQKIPMPKVEDRLDHLGVDLPGKRLFVAALGDKQNTIEVVDLKSNQRSSSIAGQSKPQGVFYSPDFNKLFVANGTDGTCKIFDGRTFKLIDSLPIGDDADHVGYDPETKYLYVGFGDAKSGGLAVIDTRTNKHIRDIKTDARPGGIKFDRSSPRIFVTFTGTDKLFAGVYWSIFNNLPANRRETFRELWGRLFEIYAVDLLRDFYPELSQILGADQKYTGGQVDALLDFGDVVIVFEIKSSLLTEPAKRSGDASKFVADFERKFVKSQKGAPKALLQLASSCKAVESRKILTAKKPARIYPVCVSDEPGVETFFFTTYVNEIFQKSVPVNPTIQPVTMMSISELEEALPYVSMNDFSWPELLGFRHHSEGGVYSVHQAVYDLLRAKGVSVRRNQAIRATYDQTWKIILSRFALPKAAG